MATSLLLSESPLQVLPSLAVAIGLNEAIAIQQLFYLQHNPENGRKLDDGERYIFNTYAEWRKYFPFWSEPTIKRVFLDLEQRSLVVTKQPEGPDRRKYYRIPDSVIVNLTHERLAEKLADHRTNSSAQRIKLIRPTDQSDPPNGSNRSVALIKTETSTETSAEKVGADEIVRPVKEPAHKPVTVIPLLLSTDEFAEAWRDWLQHRREIKHAIAPGSQTERGQLKQLESWGIDRAIAAIRFTIFKGWQGLKEPDQPKPQKPNGHGPLGLSPMR